MKKLIIKTTKKNLEEVADAHNYERNMEYKTGETEMVDVMVEDPDNPGEEIVMMKQDPDDASRNIPVQEEKEVWATRSKEEYGVYVIQDTVAKLINRSIKDNIEAKAADQASVEVEVTVE